MSYYYTYYIWYKTTENKIYPLGPYDNKGNLRHALSRSSSFASDLHEDFYMVQGEQFSDELRKELEYGCIQIVENVLDSVQQGTDCAFILPDKKLEKVSKSAVNRILSNHRLTKIIKLPEQLFREGVTTSIFVFKAGVPQDGQDIFGCYIEDDGLETVKNQGRHDVKNKWSDIEDYWIDSISKRRDTKHHTDQWINPEEHLSYQMPEKPFEISEEDFKKTAFAYLCFKQGIDTKEFGEKLLNAALYSSEVSADEGGVNIWIGGGDDD